MAGLNAFQLLNGLTFAGLLFIVASGFTLIFGLLRIVNLAHGALYLFGGYVGYAVASFTGNFAAGILGAMIAIAIIGFVLDQGLLRSFGVRAAAGSADARGAFILNDMSLVIWGGDTFTVPVPSSCAAPSISAAFSIRNTGSSCWSSAS